MHVLCLRERGEHRRCNESKVYTLEQKKPEFIVGTYVCVHAYVCMHMAWGLCVCILYEHVIILFLYHQAEASHSKWTWWPPRSSTARVHGPRMRLA